MEEPAAEFPKQLLYTNVMLHNLSQFLMYLLPYIGTRLFAYPVTDGNCSGLNLLTAAFKLSVSQPSKLPIESMMTPGILQSPIVLIY